MPCLPDRTLTPERAPYEVRILREIPWKEGRAQMLWLVEQTNDCEGHFTNGRMLVQGRKAVWYRFTCPNTAFRFKIQFS